MSVRLYLLYCQHCSFKKITDGSDLSDFHEIKTCKDCGGVRQFKCPGCGYLLRAGKASTATVSDGAKRIQKIRATEEEKNKRRELDMKKRLKEKQKLDESNDDE